MYRRWWRQPPDRVRSRCSGWTVRPRGSPPWRPSSPRRGSAPVRGAWWSGLAVPEGDTIWRLAAALRERIEGRTLKGVRPEALGRLRGRVLEAVEPRGKHILMRFSGGWLLHSHLRMTRLLARLPAGRALAPSRTLCEG